MFRKAAGQVSVAVVLFLLGLMISLQYKTIQYGGNNVNVKRVEELTAQIKKLESDKEGLINQVNSLQNKLTEYENAASKVNAVTDALKKDNEKYKIMAGLEAVRGPGIIVTLNDSTKEIQPGDNANNYIIHDDDLLQVLNELRAAGAEALSLNGERIIATSEVRCVGPTVVVNNNRFAAPFVIQAIGDPQTLQAALELKGGIVDALRYWGIHVNIKTSNDIDIPAYGGVVQFKYAKPVPSGKGGGQ
ncbi:DUF881 domain-containing protein [Caldanaerobius polysaccharolyticus]|uniref:DUF881 domain-containing protein n=1 Tax=Caldanaerobius polysaccharolyticus TaxID=44256 RepID=UPI00047ECD71|nr:DUF881 domain-containing protein [Caldanaerobius polysaccharolyticus]